MKRNGWTMGVAASAAALLATGAAGAQGVVWDADGAIAIGTGCASAGPGGDVEIIASGNDVAIVFSALDIDLPASGPDRRLADSKSCNVRIPVTLESGVSLSRLTQTLTYGVQKSAGSEGAVTVRSALMTQPLSELTVVAPEGRAGVEVATGSVESVFALDTCGMADLQGLFASDLAMSGRRSSTAEELLLAGQLDVRYEISLPIIPCR